MPSVDLHCVEAANIVSTNVSTYSSTLVGSAFIRNLINFIDTKKTNVKYNLIYFDDPIREQLYPTNRKAVANKIL